MFAAPVMVRAESSFVTGAAAPLTTTAHVDFQIIIPKVIYLQIGTGTNLTTVATVNPINFTVPAANIGNGTAVAAAAASGDLGTGAVTVRMYGNNGTYTLSTTATGQMGNGVAGQTIGWDKILVASAALPAAGHIAMYTNTGVMSTTVAAVAGVVARESQWTYTYANNSLAAAGTYGGINNTNNSRLTYTASIP